MPRSGSGTYTLPSGNPVVTGTTIESNWANTTLSDIATTLTDSLSRSGQGGMTAALRIADGTQGAPGLGFANETGSGFYRAGTAEVWAVVQGAQTMNLDASGVTVPADKATSIEGTFVFNETGADKDARFEGDTDANLLFVDASTDRVGVGTATPAAKLDVNGTAAISGNVTLSGGTANGVLYLNGSKVATSGSALTFDGATLGATAKLQITSPSNTRYSDFNTTSSGYGFSSYSYNGTAYGYVAQSSAFSGGVNTDFAVIAVNNLRLGGGNALQATLDSSGNLGLGVTPGVKLDIGSGTLRIKNATGDASGLLILQDTSDTAKIINYYNGPLVFGTNNTERARITGGDLLVGTTVNLGATNDRLQVNQTTGSARAAYFKNITSGAETAAFWNTDTGGNNLFLQFYTEATATARGSISYNRAGGLTAYNTTSDYRAKDIIGPVQDPGATIDALKVYEGKMKGATQSRPMLIAHEAQAVTPYAVSGVKDEVNEDGSPKFQQMDVSSLVPLLLAEIQSLRARVAALEAA